MKQVLRVIAYAFVIPTVLFFSCGDDDESPLLVEADFSVNDSSIVAGQEVTFTDNSTGEPTSWEWSFEGGDPSSSTAQDPKVTYTTPGVYSVTLTASNGENSGTKEKEEWITVVLRIEADFSVNDSLIVVGQEVTFTDTSQGEPTSWEWSFEGGDPSSSTAQGPKVIYTTSGVYPVTLTASNGESSDTEEKKEFITVISEIEADFFVNDSSIVVGQEVTFTDISTGEPTNWAWSFEGGNPSSATVQNPKVTYSAPGEYSVTLTASNEDLTGSIEKENFIKVFLPVEASFTADQVILFQGDQVSFTNTSEGAPSDILWTFEGGTPATSTDPNPVVTYDIPGTYNVTLSASNEASSDTEEKEAFVKVVGPVTTQFEADKLSVIAGEDVTFTDRSFGEPNSWQWSFEGGTPSTSTMANPTVVYSTPGIYEVSLEVSNEFDSETLIKNRYILVSDLPSQGLIAYYPFDGDGKDNGSMTFNGTLFGGVRPTTDRNDRQNMALDFLDGYVRTTDELDNNMGNGVTFAAWIYLPTETGTSMAIVSNFNGQGIPIDGCTPGTRVGFIFMIQPDRSLRMSYSTNSAKYRGRITPANTLELNTWYHIAGTWDGRTENNNAFKLYVNGVARDNATFESGLASDICDDFVESERPFYFGRSTCATGPCAPFTGVMDDLVIYNRVLDASEIQLLAQQD